MSTDDILFVFRQELEKNSLNLRLLQVLFSSQTLDVQITGELVCVWGLFEAATSYCL